MSVSLLPSIPVSSATTREFAPRSLLPLLANSLWKIEAGVVRTCTWLEDGTMITLGLWGPDDVVGKPLSRMEPYQIECLMPVTATTISLETNQQTQEALLAHIQQVEELMVIRSHRRVDLMLVQLLTWLAKKFGRVVEQGQLIDLRLTHQDIAEILGTTRVTITRSLSQLEQQGLIRRISLHRILLQAEEIWYYEI